MALLTEVFPVPGKVPTGKVPLWMAAPVHEDLEPFLVTSSRSCCWLYATALRDGCVRTAWRKATLEKLYGELVFEIADKGRELEWGNVHPASYDGVSDAILHLADYGILDVDVIHGVEFDTTIVPEDITCSAATWLPPKEAVILSVDRACVGTAYVLSGGHHAVVVHNASRGVCVIVPETS